MCFQAFPRGELYSCYEAIRLGNGFPNQRWGVNLAGTEAPVERRKNRNEKESAR